MERDEEALGRLEAHMNEVKTQREAAASEQQSLESQLEDFQYPRAWRTGLYILLGFSVVGILFPLVLINSAWDDVYTPCPSWTALGLFIVSLGAEFIYHYCQLTQAQRCR
jgi:hypothetical protein